MFNIITVPLHFIYELYLSLVGDKTLFIELRRPTCFANFVLGPRSMDALKLS